MADSHCQICLKRTRRHEEYHPECSQLLFGITVLPKFEFNLQQLYSAAVESAGRMSISGVQEKASLKLSSDKTHLEITEIGGRYILKPQTSTFPGLPQNEHVTMLIAGLLNIETPPFGLLRLRDGTLAYVIKRFDRTDDGGKLQVEDFCQLSEKNSSEKYEGSAESCVRMLRKYATTPLLEIHSLFRLFLFSWWVGNGDLHLKNMSLLTTLDQQRRLSPAYDVVNTRLVLPKDDLALSIGGRRRKLAVQNWIDFADYCELPPKAARNIFELPKKSLAAALRTIDRSFLGEEEKAKYKSQLVENAALLTF